EHVLYEKGFSSVDITDNEIINLNIPQSVISNANFLPIPGDIVLFFYFILEFDPQIYDNTDSPKFVLNEFDIRPAEFRPNLITTSNVVGAQNERFFVHFRSDFGSIIYRTQNN